MSYTDDIRKKFDHVDRNSPSLQRAAQKIKEILDDVDDDLANLYAYLVLTTAETTSNKDVHDAWSYWTLVDRDNSDHKSLVPFEDLTREVQDMDSKYRDAIREVARERTANTHHFYDPLVYFEQSMIADDFKTLLPKVAADPDDGPIYYLWVFDPHEDKVHVEHNEDRHPADAVDHSHLGARVPHPDRVHGFAYRIRGGWRITTDDHRTVDDPHVLEAVRLALKGEKRSTPEIAPRHKS